jgi:hypothetical protein
MHLLRRLADAVAGNDQDSRGGGVEDDVDDVIVQEVDLVDVQDAPVGLFEQAGLALLPAFSQQGVDLPTAYHPVFSSVDRQGYR